MTLRAAGKLTWFAVHIFVDVADYFFRAAFVSKKNKRAARAAWLQRASRQHLKIFNFQAEVSGPIPATGLIVSNHLSYLDILALSSVVPAVFVSKADVRRWPLFGWLASLGGTIFIERERRAHVGAVNREIESVLDAGIPVVVFPEGTSSDGGTVLPFRSSLLEPALRGAHEITVSWIHYDLADGDAGQEVCYWGDHSFFPHLLNLFDKRIIRTTLRFGKFQRTTGDRKELARQLHAAILELKRSAPGTGVPTSLPAR